MSTAAPARKDFLSILDFDAIELERCLEIATHVKADRPLGRQAPTSAALEGRHVAMLFEKASLRTRNQAVSPKWHCMRSFHTDTGSAKVASRSQGTIAVRRRPSSPP